MFFHSNPGVRTSASLFPYTTLFRSPRTPPRPPRPGPPAARRGGRARPAPPPARWTSARGRDRRGRRSEEHTSELQSREKVVCRLLLEKKKIPVELRQHT